MTRPTDDDFDPHSKGLGAMYAILVPLPVIYAALAALAWCLL
jgi:hypothetical protein